MTPATSAPLRLALLLLVAACSPAAETRNEPTPAATLVLVRSGSGGGEIRLDGKTLARVHRDGSSWTLRGDSVTVDAKAASEPLAADHPYPRRIALEARLGEAAVGVLQEFTLLAPPAPLSVEGLGLEVSTDEPGTNREEHRELSAWLARQGLPPSTAAFAALHEAEAGRELRVWYEISGRRVDGALRRTDSIEPLARFDSLFRSEDEQLKIHHKRPGENGRFRYHRQSLERVDTLASTVADVPELVSHECGCYGYAIAADFMTFGSSLYRVEVDWLDDRVAADFFLGLERREEFPWVRLGDRRRMRDLARRAAAYRLKDARGTLFAEVALDLPRDPPTPGLGPAFYRIDRFASDGSRAPLARVDHSDAEITIYLFGDREGWRESLETLDALLAAMPTQVMRGDGVRDSHLGEIEWLVDLVRLLGAPDDVHLADAVSDIDALTAPSKVHELLGQEAERFVADAEALPPTPMRVAGLAVEPTATLGSPPVSSAYGR